MTADFGIALGADAQAFGQPGERTFRLRIKGAEGESASVWLEKEQLQALSLAFKQMLAQLDYPADDAEPAQPDVGDFPVVAEHDFRAGRMGMGFDAAEQTIALYLYEAGLEEEDDPTVRVRLRQEQCASLMARLDEIISGGRPLCPLCGLAVDAAGHMCVRANGHSVQPIPDEDQSADASP
jgi:uncharacterized repeat protein (TIGR03847 family)